jgi:hypothetical protein
MDSVPIPKPSPTIRKTLSCRAQVWSSESGVRKRLGSALAWAGVPG